MDNIILLALICISYGYVVWRIIRNATIQDKRIEDALESDILHRIDSDSNSNNTTE